MGNANVYQDSPALVVKNFVRKDIGVLIVTSHVNAIVQIMFVIPLGDASVVPGTGVRQALATYNSHQCEKQNSINNMQDLKILLNCIRKNIK